MLRFKWLCCCCWSNWIQVNVVDEFNASMTMELPNRRMFGERGRSLLMRLNSDWRSHIRIGFMVVINNICEIFQLKPFVDAWLLLVQRCCPVRRTCWVFDCQQPLWLLQNEANLFKWVQWVCLEAQPRESSVLFHFLSAACRASLWGRAEWEAAFGTGGCQWHLATRLPLPQTLFLYYEGIISRTDPPCVFFFLTREKQRRTGTSPSRELSWGGKKKISAALISFTDGSATCASKLPW